MPNICPKKISECISIKIPLFSLPVKHSWTQGCIHTFIQSHLSKPIPHSLPPDLTKWVREVRVKANSPLQLHIVVYSLLLLTFDSSNSFLNYTPVTYCISLRKYLTIWKIKMLSLLFHCDFKATRTRGSKRAMDETITGIWTPSAD